MGHRVMYFSFTGASNFLPNVSESVDKRIQLVDSLVVIDPLKFLVKSHDFNLTFQGQNLREAVIRTLDKLQKHLLEHHVDDHKSLHAIGKIYECALHYFGITRTEFDHR